MKIVCSFEITFYVVLILSSRSHGYDVGLNRSENMPHMNEITLDNSGVTDYHGINVSTLLLRGAEKLSDSNVSLLTALEQIPDFEQRKSVLLPHANVTSDHVILTPTELKRLPTEWTRKMNVSRGGNKRWKHANASLLPTMHQPVHGDKNIRQDFSSTTTEEPAKPDELLISNQPKKSTDMAPTQELKE